MAASYARKFKANPYGFRVYLFDDAAKFVRFANSRNCGRTLAELRKYTTEADGLTLFHGDALELYLGVFDKEPATLAHECVHGAVYILSHAGVRFSTDNNEQLAYLVGHMFDECFPAILRSWK
jgi:hypothetical protein